MNRLAGKIALITGAAGGIGRAIGERFHAEGASVVLADIDGDRVAEATKAIDHDGARAAVDATIVRFGRLDVLVNNAAAHTPNHTIDTLSIDDWDSTIAVNLSGAFLMSRAAIAPMKAQGFGLIIHLASQLGHVGAPQRAAYAATKAALVSLARTMASDEASFLTGSDLLIDGEYSAR